MTTLLYHSFKHEYAIGYLHNAGQENEQIYTIHEVHFFWQNLTQGLKKDFTNTTFGYDTVDEAKAFLTQIKRQGVLFLTKSLRDDLCEEQVDHIYQELQIFTKEGTLVPA